ncbi:hypothetical protein JKG47_09365 [Acidithiobacillus sp. MC6.1]|nr:hypothetical protein [Acidithiobacillus sp. MC6.1]MBU2764930.1 hypothetical protein [Acidithiobacillus ferrivorans]
MSKLTHIAVDETDFLEDDEDWTGRLLWTVEELRAHGIPSSYVGMHIGFPVPKDFFSQMRAYPPSRRLSRVFLERIAEIPGYIGNVAKHAIIAVPEEEGIL